MSDTKYERKCENWLSDYAKWTLPRCIAPQSYVLWSGLFVLSAAIRRRVFVGRNVLGNWDAYPNLYVMFVGPAGGPKKSTTIAFAEELLREIKTLNPTPEMITKESLLSTLANSSDCSMYVLASEFSEFIVKSGPDMYGFLTNVFDGLRQLSASTLSRGVELAEKPCIGILAGTTPDWIAGNMPESVIGGGFASRVMFIYESEPRMDQLYFRETNWPEMNRLRGNLIADLNHIANSIVGEFRITDEAMDFMEAWNKENAPKFRKASPKMQGFYNRAPAHIHRVAQLIHLAYSDDLTLTLTDMKQAVGFVMTVEKKFAKTFESVGKNPYTVDVTQMLEYIVDKGRVQKGELLTQFRAAATPEMLKSLVQGLIDMGLVKVTVDNDQVCYEPNISNIVEVIPQNDPLIPEAKPDNPQDQ